MPPRRLLFFASPIGLGHATRDIAIAEKLKSGISDEVLFVSGLAAAALIANKSFSVLDLLRPPAFEAQSGVLQHRFRWLARYFRYYAKSKKVAKSILERHGGPVVSDEDFASIAVAQQAERRSILITDITETRFTSGPASIIERRMNQAMRKMMKRCDCIIIPDFGEDKDSIVHVGPIVREVSADRAQLRKRFGFTKNTIVASVGGTDAGRQLLDKVIDAHRRIKQRLDSDLVIVSGPSISIADSADFRNLGFVDNLHELIYAADLVVSLAGKSTMDESIAYGTPGIFIPIKNHFEQEDGASKLGYKYDDIFRLEALIAEKIGMRRNVENRDGAGRAAEIIARFLD